MLKEIKFAKIVAAGNDFIVIDNRKNQLRKWKRKVTYSNLAKKLCNRNFSVGADGLLILENSKIANFKMLYFNSDGSQAAMCGNGARCIAYYAFLNKIVSEQNISFETLAGIVKAKVMKHKGSEAKVRIKLPEPKDIKLDFCLNIDSKSLNVSFANTGVPHTVIFSSELDSIDVKTLGKEIRFHKHFLPEGTNVNFVKVLNEHQLNLRTYERGIEDETKACGTGAVAAAVISTLKDFVKSPVSCKTASGEILTVYFKIAKEDLLMPVYNLYLEGKVQLVFCGTIGR